MVDCTVRFIRNGTSVAFSGYAWYDIDGSRLVTVPFGSFVIAGYNAEQLLYSANVFLESGVYLAVEVTEEPDEDIE